MLYEVITLDLEAGGINHQVSNGTLAGQAVLDLYRLGALADATVVRRLQGNLHQFEHVITSYSIHYTKLYDEDTGIVYQDIDGLVDQGRRQLRDGALIGQFDLHKGQIGRGRQLAQFGRGRAAKGADDPKAALEKLLGQPQADAA